MGLGLDIAVPRFGVDGSGPTAGGGASGTKCDIASTEMGTIDLAA
jgi:hypothetical protein